MTLTQLVRLDHDESFSLTLPHDIELTGIEARIEHATGIRRFTPHAPPVLEDNRLRLQSASLGEIELWPTETTDGVARNTCMRQAFAAPLPCALPCT